MEIIAEVDNDVIFKCAIEFLSKKLSFDSMEIICGEIFKSDDLYLKDLMGLAISHLEDPRFIELMEEVIMKEKHQELKKDLSLVLKELYFKKNNKR